MLKDEQIRAGSDPTTARREALLACWLPGLRAMRTDLAVALRAD
jgi:hypothetical protein